MKIKNKHAIAITSALLASNLTLASPDIQTSPFAATEIDGGYKQPSSTEGKCGEGKCGEGKCGTKKNNGNTVKEQTKQASDKVNEGKCGNDKSGEGKCGAH